jgi:transcriptional regulator with XRE-family HTH domain
MARQKAGLSQRELAASAGQTQQSISAYETGLKDPTLSTLKRLLAAAGFDMRIHLEPLDNHDAVLEVYMDSLDSTRRAALEQAQRERVAAAKLRRTRGQ